MLGKDYIYINSTLIPAPASFTVNYDNIEDVNQSEVGTDRVAVTRLQKVALTMTFQVTEFWRQKLLVYGRDSQVSLKIGASGTAMFGRFRISSDYLQPYSNMANQPCWTVHATFNQV